MVMMVMPAVMMVVMVVIVVPVMMVVVMVLRQLNTLRFADGALFVCDFKDRGGVGNWLEKVGERSRFHSLAEFG